MGRLARLALAARAATLVSVAAGLALPVSCGGRSPIAGLASEATPSGGGGGQGQAGRGGAAGSGGSVTGRCSEDAVLCDGVCTDVDFDPQNCGDCGAACESGELCSRGACAVGCGPGTELCGERCADIAVDPDNCGECAFVCGAGAVCSGGVCGESCTGNLTACSGECVDLELDPEHCGACDAACEALELCSVGACGTSCVGGATQCLDACVDLQNDPEHCGNCSTVCGEDEVCSEGQCGVDCRGGTTRCGDRCVDTDVDSKHCGGCGQPCATDEVCSEGSCASVCGGGLTKCGNACVDTEADPQHCGECGEVCGPGQKCVTGACEECDSSVEDCDNDGWFAAEGDCCDKPGFCGSDPSLVNPGALEVIGNGVDDNCNEKADLFDTEDLAPCDGGLASDSNDALDYARAFGLCKTTEESPKDPSERTWGVLDVKLVRANGGPLTASSASSIRPHFGAVSVTQGQSLAVLSTGIASDATQTDPGPNGGAPAGQNVSIAHFPTSSVNIASCSFDYCVEDWFGTANPPLKNAGQLPRAPDCGADNGAVTANDSVMFVLRMRAPTNVRAFSFNSYFLSAEYPEYVCSSFNDQFIALVDTPDGAPAPIPNPIDKNLLTYTQGGSQWPIGINIAQGTNLFAVCAPESGNPCWNGNVNPASCSLGIDDLIGTGFEAPSSTDPSCTIGGGTHWLTTAGNVVPGGIVELRIAIWDVGDAGFDSTALIDGFQWLPNATLPGTN